MKTLYLVRHAKSSWSDASLMDWQRPLNKRGKRDAPFMGKLIAEKGIRPDALVTSTAVRAYTTAEAFASALGYSKESIVYDNDLYGASVMELMDIVNNLDDDWDSAMVFGHNMTYTDFVNIYATPNLDNVPTTGIVAIQFEVDLWEEVTRRNGQFLFFEYPRKYFPKKTE